MVRALTLLLVLGLSGCSFIDDFGRFSVPDSGADVGSDTGTDSTVMDGGTDTMVADSGAPDTRPPLPSCAAGFLEPTLPVSEDTGGAADDNEGTCGGAGSNDVVYAFVAPEDDYYLFETNGSGFDTVLYLDESCTGDVELACNDDGAVPPQSEVVYQMTMGQTVIVVADGNAGDSGDLTLTAGPVTCPDTDLIPAILPVETTTAGRPDDHTSACGGGGAGDRAFRYTAAAAGLHRFTVTSSTTGYDPLISVERGPICGGEVVQCHGSNQDTAEVTRHLSDGEVLTIRVDGRAGAHEGNYSLDVTEPAGACDALALDASGPVAGTLEVRDGHTHSGSCGEAYYIQSVSPRVTHENPDVGFLVTGIPMPPAPPCSVFCEVSVTADFPFILSMQEGSSCNGNELACESSMPDGFGFRGSVEVVGPQPAGGEALIILDRQVQDNDVSGIAVPYPNSYSVDYFCAAVC